MFRGSRNFYSRHRGAIGGHRGAIGGHRGPDHPRWGSRNGAKTPRASNIRCRRIIRSPRMIYLRTRRAPLRTLRLLKTPLRPIKTPLRLPKSAVPARERTVRELPEPAKIPRVLRGFTQIYAKLRKFTQIYANPAVRNSENLRKSQKFAKISANPKGALCCAEGRKRVLCARF